LTLHSFLPEVSFEVKSPLRLVCDRSDDPLGWFGNVSPTGSTHRVETRYRTC